MKEDDFSRFHKTDCKGIDLTDSEKYSQIFETYKTFSNVFIRACEGSENIPICFTGRGGFVDPTTVYILPYKDLDCKSLDSDIEVSHQRQITLYTSGYIEDTSE